MTELPPETESSTVSADSVIHEPVETSPPGPSFLQAIGFVLVWQVVVAFCSGVPRLLFGDIPSFSRIFTSNVCSLIGYVIAWLIVFLILIRESRGTWRAYVPLRRVRAREIAFAVVVKLVIVFGLLAIAYFLPFYSDIRPAEDPEMIHPAALALAVVGVIGPICEELFFRGWVLRGFLNRYAPAKATMLSAFLFALVHINPLLMVVTFSTGCFYAWMVRRTGSLIPTIAAHIVGNTLFVVGHIIMGR